MKSLKYLRNLLNSCIYYIYLDAVGALVPPVVVLGHQSPVAHREALLKMTVMVQKVFVPVHPVYLVLLSSIRYGVYIVLLM